MIHIYIQLKEEKNTAKDFAAMIEIRAKLSEAAFVSPSLCSRPFKRGTNLNRRSENSCHFCIKWFPVEEKPGDLTMTILTMFFFFLLCLIKKP